MGEIERGPREPEPEGLDYVKVGLGLVFVFGAFVFGILSPPGTLVISFGLMIPAVALIASALQDAKKRRASLLRPLTGNGICSRPSGTTVGQSLQWRRRWRPRSL